MSIIRLQHIGIVVRDFAEAWDRFDRILGMTPRDFRNDQGKGMQHDARVLLGNDCWIHVVYNWNPESRVYRFLQDRGEGLEHIALETDDIETDVARLREQNVPIFEDTLFNANDGYEAFVYPQDGIGFTVELIQIHTTSWTYPDETRALPVSTKLGVRGIQQLSARVGNVEAAARRFGGLFGLQANDGRVPLGNCELHLVQDPSDEPCNQGLEALALETETLDDDLRYLRKIGVPVVDGRSLDAERGVGFSIDLVKKACSSDTNRPTEKPF